MSQFEVLGPVT